MGYNYLGTRLRFTEMYAPSNPDFFDADGLPNWELIHNGDRDGFDISVSLGNQQYKKTIILPVGKRIIRYGVSNGRYTTDDSTPYELLSLPYTKESMEYHEYEVIMACKVDCVVEYGYVAPGFHSVGGAVQYRHEIPIRQSLKDKILREDLSWLKSLQKKS